MGPSSQNRQVCNVDNDEELLALKNGDNVRAYCNLDINIIIIIIILRNRRGVVEPPKPVDRMLCPTSTANQLILCWIVMLLVTYCDAQTQ